MGTDIGEDDMENIVQLADQVIEITDYRAQLFEYLKVRYQKGRTMLRGRSPEFRLRTLMKYTINIIF